VLLIKALGGGWDQPVKPGQVSPVSPLSDRQNQQPAKNEQSEQRPGGQG
jgi:hypothetical protein